MEKVSIKVESSTLTFLPAVSVQAKKHIIQRLLKLNNRSYELKKQYTDDNEH